jgi:predicted nuclease of restriction endonuclease-like (RecB) superfamily
MNDDDPIRLTSPPAGYAEWLSDLKTQIHVAQQRTAQALNLHLVSLYWQIGKAILEQQENQGWGAKIIDRLAQDLRTNFPAMKGFSPRNLKYMRAFADAWPEGLIVQQLGGQMENGTIGQAMLGQSGGGNRPADGESFVQQLLHKLPWTHHCMLLDKLKTREDRLWYAQKTIEYNWSRNVLVM